MKIFTRMLALLLAVLMLSVLVVACNDDSDDDGSGNNGGLIDDRYDINGRLNDNLDPNLNYKGEEVTVMYWSDAENIEFEIESVTGDNVSDAIFDRNNRIEDRLNVDLLWMGEPGNTNNRKSFVQRVSSYAQSGQSKVDIIAVYSQTAGSLAVQGLLIDLATIQNSHIDLDMPWWPSQMVETVSFGNSYYFLTGDISTNVLHMMHLLYVNKDMMSRFDKKIEDVYKMVYDGTWTLDALIELTSGVYRELDGKNGKTAGDQYGLTGRSYVLDAFYIGSNMRLIDSSDEDYLTISEDLGSLKTVKLVRKLGQVFNGNDWITMKFGDEPDYDAAVNDLGIFCDGRAMVIQQHAQAAEKTMVGKVDFSYGVLPMPKYDTKQVNYYTSLGNPHSIYGLFVSLNGRGDKEATLSMLSAVLECWASEGYRLTTPEIFEVNMQLKYSEGQDETNMFEYVRMGITMDLGRPMTAELLTISQQVGKCISTNASWSTYWGAYERAVTSRLADVVEDFKWYQESRTH